MISLFCLAGRQGLKSLSPICSAPFRPVMLAHPLVPKKDRGDPGAIDPDLINAETRLRPSGSGMASAFRPYRKMVSGASIPEPATTSRTLSLMCLPRWTSMPRLTENFSCAALMARSPHSTSLQQSLKSQNCQQETDGSAPAFIRAYDIAGTRRGRFFAVSPFEIERAQSLKHLVVRSPKRIVLMFQN